jgi:hypothetical protein
MVLAGHLAIGLLEFLVGRVAIDAKSFVIIAFRHRCHRYEKRITKTEFRA